jgi:hypothetical protein
MPPFFIPPLVKLALGALGAGAVVGWVIKEARRLNGEVERAQAPVLDPAARQAMPTLRRDARTGEWRVM